MLRLTLEYIPYGIELRTQAIGQLTIINNRSHKDRPQMGNYTIEVHPQQNENHPPSSLAYEVTNHHRDDGVWSLLKKVFEEMEVANK